MKAVSILVSILLFTAVLQLPIGYYRFLRIAVTITVIYLISNEVKKGINIWVLILGTIGILFNPILSIYIGSKSSWMPIDVTCGVVFLTSAFKTNSNDK